MAAAAPDPIPGSGSPAGAPAAGGLLAGGAGSLLGAIPIVGGLVSGIIQLVEGSKTPVTANLPSGRSRGAITSRDAIEIEGEQIAQALARSSGFSARELIQFANIEAGNFRGDTPSSFVRRPDVLAQLRRQLALSTPRLPGAVVSGIRGNPPLDQGAPPLASQQSLIERTRDAAVEGIADLTRGADAVPFPSTLFSGLGALATGVSDFVGGFTGQPTDDPSAAQSFGSQFGGFVGQLPGVAAGVSDIVGALGGPDFFNLPQQPAVLPGGAFTPAQQPVPTGHTQFFNQGVNPMSNIPTNVMPGGAIPALFDIPGIDIVPQGTPTIQPQSRTSSRLPARIDVRKANGNFTTYRNMGSPVLWSGDIACSKRVKRVAMRTRRAVGARRGGR